MSRHSKNMSYLDLKKEAIKEIDEEENLMKRVVAAQGSEDN